MTIEPDAIQLANRVGACALGLAFAERSDDEALGELIDMAGGRRCALEQARARVSELGTIDETVMHRAVHLLETAATTVPSTDDGPEAGGSDVLLASPGN
jgi:hypothetical protein